MREQSKQSKLHSTQKRDKRLAPVLKEDRSQLDFLSSFAQWLEEWENMTNATVGAEKAKRKAEKLLQRRKEKAATLEGRSINELREALDWRGLPTAGKKQDLVLRLKDYLRQNPDDGVIIKKIPFPQEDLNKSWQEILGASPPRNMLKEWIAFQKKKWQFQAEKRAALRNQTIEYARDLDGDITDSQIVKKKGDKRTLHWAKGDYWAEGDTSRLGQDREF